MRVGFSEFLAVRVEPPEKPALAGKWGQAVFGNQLLGAHARKGLPRLEGTHAGEDAGDHRVGDDADEEGDKKDDGGLDQSGEVADLGSELG